MWSAGVAVGFILWKISGWIKGRERVRSSKGETLCQKERFSSQCIEKPLIFLKWEKGLIRLILQIDHPTIRELITRARWDARIILRWSPRQFQRLLWLRRGGCIYYIHHYVYITLYTGTYYTIYNNIYCMIITYDNNI